MWAEETRPNTPDVDSFDHRMGEKVARIADEQRWRGTYGPFVPDDWKGKPGAGAPWSNIMRAVNDTSSPMPRWMIDAALHFPHPHIPYRIGLARPLSQEQLDFLINGLNPGDAQDVLNAQAAMRAADQE